MSCAAAWAWIEQSRARGRSFTAIPAGTGLRRWVPTATALPDGSALVAGGHDERVRILSDAHLIKAV